MGDENEFQMSMRIGVVFVNRYRYKYVYRFLKFEPNFAPYLLVKCNKIALKLKNKC